MLSSMTGFASLGGETTDASWVFEIKSVNGRGLDVRLNLPQGCEKLEQPVRNALKDAFARGNMQASLQLRERSEAQAVRFDTRLLSSYARRARLMDGPGRKGSRATDFFALRGVLQSEKTVSEVTADSRLGLAILSTIETAVSQLDDARKGEGRALLTVLDRIIADMVSETEAAAGTAEAQPVRMMARLRERMEVVLEDSRISEERLEQEVAVLITKADVTEELDRLKAHFAEARRLLASGQPVGRKLDFLSQELLREANTLGSKAASLEMTRHSLSLKSLIDQFKEQAANVE